MMTTENSRFLNIKKVLVLPVIVILCLAFSEKTEAKLKSQSVPVLKVSIPYTPKVTRNAPPIIIESADKDLEELPEKVQPENFPQKDTIVKKNQTEPVASTKERHIEFKGILPQFPGGINAFRTLLANNFDTSVFKGGEGLVETMLWVEIGEDGRMGNVSAEGTSEVFNKEAVRSVKSVQDNIWTPATDNGAPVKYVFKMPLTMQFARPTPEK